MAVYDGRTGQRLAIRVSHQDETVEPGVEWKRYASAYSANYRTLMAEQLTRLIDEQMTKRMRGLGLGKRD